MDWFEALKATLIAEKISTEYYSNQFFCAGRPQTIDTLKQLPTRKWTVVVDGIYKKSAETLSCDEWFAEVLAAAGITYEFVNLSTEQGTPLHASIACYLKLRQQLKEKEAVIVLGSGTITDLVKHALKDSPNIPLVSVATALTVTAYTSAFAILEDSGAKRSIPSRIPDINLWIYDLVAAAPKAMNQAGYGDLLARFVAQADWYLGHHLGISERYDETSFRLMNPYVEALKRAATEVNQQRISIQSVESLCAALAMAGIAMNASNETTPLSGYEHTISHGLDYLHYTSQRQLALHGAQVALGTLISATSYDWLFENTALIQNKFEDLIYLDESNVTNLIHSLLDGAPYFPDLNPGVRGIAMLKNPQILETIENVKPLFVTDYLKKHRMWIQKKDKINDILKNWPDFSSQLKSRCSQAQEIILLLNQAGLPQDPEELIPFTSAEEFRWAIRFSPFARQRFCLADFLFWLGEDPVLISAR